MSEATVRALMAVARARAVGAGAGLRAELNKFDQRGILAEEARVLEALTEWFASRDAIAATELSAEMIDELVSIGVGRQAAITIGAMVMSRPLTGRSRHGSPSSYEGMPANRRVASEEPEYRAAYVLAASRRLTAALIADVTEDDAYARALKKERRYLGMHVAAGRNRRRAARKVDQVSKDDGPLLIWRTQGDSRVESECAALEGRLFTADNPPDGIFPGAAHPRCRCFAESWGGVLFT